jgi:hypothetical protein
MLSTSGDPEIYLLDPFTLTSAGESGESGAERQRTSHFIPGK